MMKSLKCRKNICKQFFSSQISGRGFRDSFEIPQSCFSESNDVAVKIRKEINSLLKIALQQPRSCTSIYQHVKSIWSIFITNDNSTLDVGQIFCDYGGVEIFCDILLVDIFEINGDQPSVLKCPTAQNTEAQYLLSVICRSLTESSTSFHHLRWRPRLIEALLSCLINSNPLNHTALVILEMALLGTDQPPIYFSKLHHFRSFLERLTFSNKECAFFHLLSSFMSDSECVASSNSTLEKHDQWLAMRSTHVVEENHKFLLEIPNFLENLCASISQCSSATSSSIQAPSEVNSLVSVLQLFAMHQNFFVDINDVFDDNLNFSSSVQQLHFHSSKYFIADIFHLLSIFLLGKFRNEVQHRMAACDFFTSLQQPAEKIVWEKTQQHQILWEFSRDPDDFSVETLVRIQFLRLIHAIAENHANRYFLLTSSELSQLKQLAKVKKLELPPPLLEFERHHGAPLGEKGLLSLIVDKLKLEDGQSLVRFWITRALESFLRGETCALHQLFLINKNVIEDMVGVLLHCGPQHEMVLQGSFDFLSTIMRNNHEAFLRCEASIDCTATFVQLVKKIDEHLIDSNMFLRCIILTNHCIKIKGGPSTSSRLLDWYVKSEVLLDVAAKLIRLLTVPTLSQENVSCLNTTILILYLAQEDDQLPSYLSSLSDFHDGQFLIGNLKNLLQFWKSHYTLPKKKIDRRNLEVSTGISFSKWCEFVDILLSIDQASLCSLRHYLHDKKVSTNNLFRRSRIP